MLDLLYIVLSFLLFVGFIAWCEEALRDWFEFVAKIDSSDYERKNRRD